MKKLRKYKLRPGLMNQINSANIMDYNKITMGMLMKFISDIQFQKEAGRLIMENHGFAKTT